MGDILEFKPVVHAKKRLRYDPDFSGIAEVASYHAEAIEIANIALIGSPPYADTAPSEYSAPEHDGA